MQSLRLCARARGTGRQTSGGPGEELCYACSALNCHHQNDLHQDRQQHEPVWGIVTKKTVSGTSTSKVKELKRNHTSIICLPAWCHTATVLGQTSSATNFVILGNTYLYYYKWYLSRYSLKNSSLFLFLESEYSNHLKHFISFLNTYTVVTAF